MGYALPALAWVCRWTAERLMGGFPLWVEGHGELGEHVGAVNVQAA